MGIFLLLAAGTYLGGKLQPDLIYGIAKGYSSNELKKILTFPFKNVILTWGLELGLIFSVINAAKGFVYAGILRHHFSFTIWEQWLGLCLFIITATLTFEAAELNLYWKRWTIYLGGVTALLPELAQLSLAVFLALLLLTRRKKYLIWSSTMAGLTFILWRPFSYSEMSMILLTCLAASFGFSLSRFWLAVNNVRSRLFHQKTPKSHIL